MKLNKFCWAVPLLLAQFTPIGPHAGAAEVKRTPFTREESAAPENSPYAAKMVSADNLIFPSAVCGTKPDALDQVDEVVEKMNARLAERGLGFGNMLQHTIFVKNGAADPIEVLNRFHAAATRVAPSLKTLRSVGTIIRLPSLPGPNTLIMLDMVAGAPLANGQGSDGYARIPFVFGPKEIVESVSGNKLIFTAGLEAMDFEHRSLVPTIGEQVPVIASKLDGALKREDVPLAQMLQHNLYVTKGTDPVFVMQKFREEIAKRDAQVKDNGPGAEAIMLVDGMAASGFLLEMDAVATALKPHYVDCVSTDLKFSMCQTASAGDLTYVSQMPGIGLANKMKTPPDLDGQIQLAVEATHDALQGSGLSLANLIKVRLLLKAGAGDPVQVRKKFYEVAARYAPALKTAPPAETVLLLEGFASTDRLFELTAIAAK
jgi:enamine deaminase RidA (YjgF/YER057c/UK114 family)